MVLRGQVGALPSRQRAPGGGTRRGFRRVDKDQKVFVQRDCARRPWVPSVARMRDAMTRRLIRENGAGSR
jgi:hypothetical protein